MAKLISTTLKASCLVGISLFLLLGCGFNEPEVVRFSGKTMGTTYNITVVDYPPNIDVQALQANVARVLADIDSKMTTYQPDSELMRFNKAEPNTLVPVSNETRAVVQQALSLAELSGGSFNPAISPLVDLWGFGAGRQGALFSQQKLPSDAAINSALAETDYSTVAIEAEGLRKTAKVKLDLSAIAKGYGVDKVAEFLQGQQITNYLVEVGGEIRVAGISPRGGLWRLGIESPGAALGVAYDAIELTNMAIATSGDYRNYYEVDGKRYSHTIDSTTGRPITHNLASVTVVASDAATADGLATAISVMGPDKGMAFSELNALAVFMIVRAESEETAYNAQYSSNFAPYIAQTK